MAETEDVFDNPEDQQKEDPTVEERNDEPDFLFELVGDGKKFRDAQALARGKKEADDFIEELKRQNEELRKELDKQDYAKELLENMKTENQHLHTKEAPVDEDHTKSKVEGSEGSDVDIESIVEQALSKREQANKAQGNRTKVNQKLHEVWGDKAAEMLRERANELDLDFDSLKEVSERSPTAFFRMLGIDSNSNKPPASPPKGDKNTMAYESSSANTSGDRTWAWYEELRRNNRRKYFSPEVQRQLMEDKRRMGDKFGMPT